MLLIMNNDFFTNVDVEKKALFEKYGTMQGIIELPDSFFKNSKKSIVIIKRSLTKVKNFLIAKMPDVNDSKAMQEFLNKIEYVRAAIAMIAITFGVFSIVNFLSWDHFVYFCSDEMCKILGIFRFKLINNEEKIDLMK